VSDYRFYAAMLRFVARKTEAGDARITAMMASLTQAADEIEASGSVSVTAEALELTARAFAGVAAFLQKQILPEVVASNNATGESQVRWAIESAMTAVNTLLARAAEPDGQTVTLRLGTPPA
jgi:hypothetical protein